MARANKSWLRIAAAIFAITALSDCNRFGRNDDEATNAIANGVDVEDVARDAPWQAQIYSTYKYTDKDVEDDNKLSDEDWEKAHLSEKPSWERKHRCGAVYIGDGWLLTAAHCLTRGFLKKRRVRLGIGDLSHAHTGYKIRAAMIHKGYTERYERNDIALLKISTENVHTDVVKPISLPGRDDPPLAIGESVSVFGWGWTKPRAAGSPLARGKTIERASATLKQATLEVVPQEKCDRIPSLRSAMTLKAICAGSRKTGVDSCNGDSGGPLVRDSDGLLVGLVSLGEGCGLRNTPAVYTQVSSYLDWIARAKRAPLGRVTKVE